MSTLARRWLAIAALVGAAGVALGAFGAHGLSNRLDGLGYAADDVARRLAIFETAARYQLFHALALGLTAIVLDRTPAKASRFAAWCFLVGVLMFSGLLYVLTFVGPELRWLGAIVPLGGVSMIVGWLALAFASWRQ